MPRLVYMNISTLHSLPARQFSAGMAEIIKHGFIKDNSYTQYIEDTSAEIMNQQPDALEEVIYRSCQIKREVVERDPKEQGERALLNFGHTIGHAIEKLSDFTLYHGECVALGMAGAACISYRLGNLSETTKLDKKMESGKVKFIVLKSLGEAYITKELSDEDILFGITHIIEK